MGKNTSILLGDYFENFVNDKIASGRFSSVSEVIRTGLRLLEQEEEKIKLLRKELEVGEKSNKIEKFDSQKHLEDLHKMHL